MIIGSKVTNPGELRTEVTFMSRSVTVNAGGFQVESLVEIDTVKVKWINLHGIETWEAASMQAESPATVLRRYRSGLDTTCVIQKGTDLFEIISIDNIGERGEYLEIKVKRWRPG
jgi:SPP1 family predicted phage head-tail adaptor